MGGLFQQGMLLGREDRIGLSVRQVGFVFSISSSVLMLKKETKVSHLFWYLFFLFIGADPLLRQCPLQPP